MKGGVSFYVFFFRVFVDWQHMWFPPIQIQIRFTPWLCFEVTKFWWYRSQNIIMTKLDAFHPIFIDLAMSFKILNSTASRPIFLQLIARPINVGSSYPILYQYLSISLADIRYLLLWCVTYKYYFFLCIKLVEKVNPRHSVHNTSCQNLVASVHKMHFSCNDN